GRAPRLGHGEQGVRRRQQVGLRTRQDGHQGVIEEGRPDRRPGRGQAHGGRTLGFGEEGGQDAQAQPGTTDGGALSPPESGSASMRVLLLHNPKAGATDISADDLQEAFRDAGWEVEYMSSDGPEFTRRLASDLQDDFELVAAAGGDGTLARVICGIAAPAPPLALLPLGTANNIASALGIAGDPREIIAGLAEADSMPL